MSAGLLTGLASLVLSLLASSFWCLSWPHSPLLLHNYVECFRAQFFPCHLVPQVISWVPMALNNKYANVTPLLKISHITFRVKLNSSVTYIIWLLLPLWALSYLSCAHWLYSRLSSLLPVTQACPSDFYSRNLGNLGNLGPITSA